MLQDEDVADSLKYVVERHCEPLTESVDAFLREASMCGRLNSHYSISGIHKQCIETYRSMCTDAEAQLAEIECVEPEKHACTIQCILRDMQPRVAEFMDREAGNGRYPRADMQALSDERVKLQREMDDEVEKVLRNLRLGIPRGERLKKHDTTVISIQGGNAQVSVGSPNSTQTMERVQSAATNQFTSLTRILGDVRNQFADSDPAVADHVAINKAVANVEKEIGKSSPDLSMIRRSLVWIVDNAAQILRPVLIEQIKDWLEKGG